MTDIRPLSSPKECHPIRLENRLRRSHHAKKEVVIYDYVDAKIPVVMKMFERRKKGYAAMGYEVTSVEEQGPHTPELPISRRSSKMRICTFAGLV